MRILITGMSGFVGGHLAESLLALPNRELFGVSRNPERVSRPALPATWLRADSVDRAAITKILKDVEPEQIYHLAGYAHAGRSVVEVDLAWKGNLLATRALLDAIVDWGGRPSVLHAGSALIYGAPDPADQILDENAPFRPTNPYAFSKAAADLLCYQYWYSHGIPIVRARPMNHIGPRQSPEYAVAHFAKQLAAISMGKQPPVLQTGNLDPVRDVTDVRDVAKAYVALLERGRPGEAYNIGSGRMVSMRFLVESLIKEAGMPIQLEQRADLIRGRESPLLRANTNKLRDETGWNPAIPLEQTLKDTLDYWRDCFAKGLA